MPLAARILIWASLLAALWLAMAGALGLSWKDRRPAFFLTAAFDLIMAVRAVWLWRSARTKTNDPGAWISWVPYALSSIAALAFASGPSFMAEAGLRLGNTELPGRDSGFVVGTLLGSLAFLTSPLRFLRIAELVPVSGSDPRAGRSSPGENWPRGLRRMIYALVAGGVVGCAILLLCSNPLGHEGYTRSALMRFSSDPGTDTAESLAAIHPELVVAKAGGRALYTRHPLPWYADELGPGELASVRDAENELVFSTKTAARERNGLTALFSIILLSGGIYISLPPRALKPDRKTERKAEKAASSLPGPTSEAEMAALFSRKRR